MLLVFALAIFLSAGLLFLVQPMTAKWILPLLGGTPAVWNTAMVFYQAVLLLGYGYAHVVSTKLRLRGQVAVHAGVMLLGAIALPLALPAGWTPPAEADGLGPIAWMLGLLAVMVGGPFLVVSTTGPLVQRWFSRTDHAQASDPYFLYAASNAGSLIGLLAYPLLVERALDLRAQGWAWTIGYGVLALLVIGSGVIALRRSKAAQSVAPSAPATELAPEPALSWQRRATWVLLAAVPSSLTLGCTQYISTDLAAVPLLWVIPLTIYLLTFIVAFSRWRLNLVRVSSLMALVAVALAAGVLLNARNPIWLLVLGHLVMLFLAGLLCHGRLAADRPGPARLTEFYLWLSVGGVLGGSFNALVAPLAFESVYEYAIVLALALALRLARPARGGNEAAASEPTDKPARSALRSPVFIAGVWGLAMVLLLIFIERLGIVSQLLIAKADEGQLSESAAAWARRLNMDTDATFGKIIRAGLPCVLCFVLLFRSRWLGAGDGTLRYAAGVAALMLAGQVLSRGNYGVPLLQERTFFGVHLVALDGTGWKNLYHGTTLHGLQYSSQDPAVRNTPGTYYHRSGPLGSIFKSLGGANENGTRGLANVGVIGLGAGTTAAYAEPGRSMTFYEIDPAIVAIARNPNFFTFMSDARGSLRVVLGDGRLSLARNTEARYDLLVLDAFSSDSIPVHLMTLEAMKLYLDRLAPGGLVAYHVSNRHFDLAPVIAAQAQALGAETARFYDRQLTDEQRREGKYSSWWVVVARRGEDLLPLRRDTRWEPLDPVDPRRDVLWTDARSNILSVFVWE